MKIRLLILFILFSVFGYSQVTQTVILKTVVQMKAYNGNNAMVYLTDSSKFYSPCSPCTADEVSIFAGAGGRKWKVMSGGNGMAELIDINSMSRSSKLFSKVPVLPSYAALRNLNTADLNAGFVYKLNAKGINGEFVYQPSDTTTLDDTAVNIRNVDGKLFSRIFERVIYPEWWGAVGDNATNDGPAFNRMFRWMERQPSGSYIIAFKSNRYYTSTRIVLPSTLQTVPNQPNPFLRILAPGVSIRTDAAIDIIYRMPLSDADVSAQNSNYKLLIDGLFLVGDRATAGQTGMRIACQYGAQFENMTFAGLDTGAVGYFLTNSSFLNCFFTVFRSVGLRVQSLEGVVGTQTIASSATNITSVGNSRFFCETGSYAGLMILGADNFTFNNKNVIEGASPRYGIYFDYQGSTNVNALIIDNVWFEYYGTASYGAGASTNLKIRGAGNVSISNVQRIYPDTLFDLSNSQSGTQVLIDRLPFAGNLAAVPFKVGSGNPTFSGCAIRVMNCDPNIEAALFNPAKWADGVVPQNISYEGMASANLGLRIISSANITMIPRISTTDPFNRYLYIDNNIQLLTDNVGSLGGWYGGGDGRFRAGHFGTTGVYVDNAGRYYFGRAGYTAPDVSIARDSIGQLAVLDNSSNYKNIKAAKGIFTTGLVSLGSGYFGDSVVLAKTRVGTASDSVLVKDGVTKAVKAVAQSSITGGGGTGTVTSVSVVNANGFNGSVATATTTPAITLSTTVTGLLKGNGTAISAAVAGTDYVTPAALGAKLDTSAGYLTSISLTTPSVVYSTPINFSVTNHSATGTLALANQSPYTVFGRASGTGTPSFLTSLDSNWIPALNQKVNIADSIFFDTASLDLSGYATNTALATKQNQLNGTGFVKFSGATPSYDNSTYTPAITPITAATATKVTYNVNGLVTAGVNATTSDIAEGSNLYFTNPRAIAAPLTGYVSGAGTVGATDNILQAIQKINGNVGALVTGVSSVASKAGAVTLVKSDVGLGSVENTALSTWAGSTNITTLGTVGTGTWQGTTVGTGYGGTGLTSYTLGDIPYSSATNTLSKLAGNTTSAKQFLTQTGTGSVSAAPAWGAIANADLPLLVGYTSGAGTVSASDSYLSAIQKINGNQANDAANITTNTTNITANTTSINALKTDDYLTALQSLGSSIKAQTFGVNPQLVSSAAGLNSGQVILNAVYLYQAATLTGVKFFQVTGGSYTANNNNQVGLYSYSAGTLTLVASSTNNGSLWAGSSNTWQTAAFSSTYSAAAGMYYVGIIYSQSAQTTQPTIAVAAAAPNAAFGAMDFTNSAKLSGQLVSQTVLPSTQAMSGVTSFSQRYYFELY